MTFKYFYSVVFLGLVACSAPNSSESVGYRGPASVEPAGELPQAVMANIPADVIYEEVQVLVEPAITREVSIPPRYETVTKRVIDQPARTVERVIPSPSPSPSPSPPPPPPPPPNSDPVAGVPVPVPRISGPAPIVERVHIPPSYKTITERVLVQPAASEIIEIPPVYRTERREVLKPRHPFSWALDPENTLPYFSPPATTVQEDINNDFFKKEVDGQYVNPNLRDVFEHITGVLSRHDTLSYPYRVFKYEKGYAILTDPERIKRDGNIDIDTEGVRRDLEQKNARSFNEYISAFLRAPENRMRYIAFIVTSKRHIETSPDVATPQTLRVTLNTGGTHRSLPLELLEKYEFDDTYRVQVRVYEFPSVPKIEQLPHTLDGIGSTLGPETRLAEIKAYDPTTFAPLKFRAHKRGSFILAEFFNESQ